MARDWKKQLDEEYAANGLTTAAKKLAWLERQWVLVNEKAERRAAKIAELQRGR